MDRGGRQETLCLLFLLCGSYKEIVINSLFLRRVLLIPTMKRIAAFVWTDRSEPLGRRAIENHFEREGYDLVSLTPDSNDQPLDLSALLAARGIEPSADARLVIITDRGEWALDWYRAYRGLADDYVWLVQQAAQNTEPILAALVDGRAGEKEVGARIHLASTFDTEGFAAPFVARAPHAFALLESMEHGRCLPKRVADDPNLKPMTATVGVQPSLVPPAELELSRQPSLLPMVLCALDELDGPMMTMASHAKNAVRLDQALLEREVHGRVKSALLRLTKDPTGGQLRELFTVLNSASVRRETEVPILFSSLGFTGFYAQPNIPEVTRIRDARLAKRAHELGVQVPAFTPTVGRIAFLMMQMKRLPHAPTLLLFSYVRALRTSHPHLAIRVFVTDDFTYSPEENVLLGLLASGPSSDFEREHAAELAGLDVEIIYARTDLDRARRTALDVQRIAEFAPEAIVAFGAELSFARVLLHGHVPIVSLVMSPAPPASGRCEVFAGQRDPSEVAREFDASGLSRPRAIRQHAYAIDYAVAKRTVTRAELGVPEDAFAIVVVGNRLMVEVAGLYVDILREFVAQHDRAHILVVGPVDRPEMERRLGVDPKRLHFVHFAMDLPALYATCDVYANPFREGGSTSVSIAMVAGVPAVSLRLPSIHDSMAVLGDAGVVSTAAEYVAELDRMYRDPSYRAEEGARQRAIVLKVISWEKCLKDFLSLVDEATSLFAKAP